MEDEEDGPVTQQPFSAKSSPAPIVKPGKLRNFSSKIWG